MTFVDSIRGASLISILAAASGVLAPLPASAQGDLLVAPTRVVLSGGGGTEVILSNIGEKTATYRIALELRRMTPDGNIDDIAEAEATPAEKAALAMVRYAPRRITLQPNQPQSVRISARPPAELPNGEYRVHMSFKAIPDPTATVDTIEQKSEGLTIRLTPIYGLTIPMIVRKGQLEATAALAHPRIERSDKLTYFKVDIQRSGARSVYGDVLVLPRGGDKPLYEARGLAVYAELPARTVSLQLSPEQAGRLKGPVRVEYREPRETGGKLIAAVDATLN
jgi:P pilus assembly chaperone PapD